MATTVSLTILPTNATSIPSSLLGPTSSVFPSMGTNGDSGGGSSRGVSYFFGFLIAFLAFLLFFIGCGLGVRRGYLRRRRLAGTDELEAGDLMSTMSLERLFSRNGLPKEPVLWETTFEKGDNQWEAMMPLSAAVVPEGTFGVLPPLYTPVPMLMPNWLRPREPMRRAASPSGVGSRDMFPWWMLQRPRFLRWPPSRETATSMLDAVPMNSLSQTTSQHSLPSSLASEPTTMPMPGGSTMPLMKKPMAGPMPMPMPPMMHSDLQVVVMIAMPSQHISTSESLGELQFGVTKFPIMWDSDSL